MLCYKLHLHLYSSAIGLLTKLSEACLSYAVIFSFCRVWMRLSSRKSILCHNSSLNKNEYRPKQDKSKPSSIWVYLAFSHPFSTTTAVSTALSHLPAGCFPPHSSTGCAGCPIPIASAGSDWANCAFPLNSPKQLDKHLLITSPPPLPSDCNLKPYLICTGKQGLIKCTYIQRNSSLFLTFFSYFSSNLCYQ